MDDESESETFEDRVFAYYKVVLRQNVNRERFANTEGFAEELANSKSVFRRLMKKGERYLNRLYFSNAGEMERNKQAHRLLSDNELLSLLCPHFKKLKSKKGQTKKVHEVIQVLSRELTKPTVRDRFEIEVKPHLFAIIAYTIVSKNINAICGE